MQTSVSIFFGVHWAIVRGGKITVRWEDLIRTDVYAATGGGVFLPAAAVAAAGAAVADAAIAPPGLW